MIFGKFASLAPTSSGIMQFFNLSLYVSVVHFLFFFHFFALTILCLVQRFVNMIMMDHLSCSGYFYAAAFVKEFLDIFPNYSQFNYLKLINQQVGIHIYFPPSLQLAVIPINYRRYFLRLL